MKLHVKSITRHRRMRRTAYDTTAQSLVLPSRPDHSTETLVVTVGIVDTPALTTALPTTAHTLAKPHHNNGNKRPSTIVIYPTVSPESIVVPIVSCIFGFPLLALTVICCLRRRAKLARERARRRNCELDRGELSVVRVSPVKRTRAISLVRSPRPLPALELDTVMEEKSDPEQTQVEMMTPDREVSAILFPSGCEASAVEPGGERCS